jgi:hypothetical protein
MSKKDDKLETNLSHEELLKKMDDMSRVNIGEDLTPFFRIQNNIKTYKDEITERTSSRDKGAIHYSDGIKTGLPHKPYNFVEHSYETSDQKLRNDVLKETKENYRRYNSLSKFFPKEADFETKEKTKDDKNLDKDR